MPINGVCVSARNAIHFGVQRSETTCNDMQRHATTCNDMQRHAMKAGWGTCNDATTAAEELSLIRKYLFLSEIWLSNWTELRCTPRATLAAGLQPAH
jgi:hypothetical protein